MRCCFGRRFGGGRKTSKKQRSNQPEPDQPQPDQPEPDQLQPDQQEPDQLEPHQPEPDQLEPDQPEPDQLEPHQPEPDQLEPDQPEPDQLEPDQLELDQQSEEEQQRRKKKKEEWQRKIEALEIKHLKENHYDVLGSKLDDTSVSGVPSWIDIAENLIGSTEKGKACIYDIRNGRNGGLIFLNHLGVDDVTVQDFREKAEKLGRKDVVDHIDKIFGNNTTVLIRKVQKEGIARMLNSTNTRGVACWRYFADAFNFDDDKKRNIDRFVAASVEPTKRLFQALWLEFKITKLVVIQKACEREDVNVVFEKIFKQLVK